MTPQETLEANYPAITLDPKEFYWHTGLHLEGFNLQRQPKGWFLVVRARRVTGERVVAFYGGEDLADTWLAFCWASSHNVVTWKPDRFAKT